MKKLLIHNFNAIIVFSLLIGIGFCFGGKIGIGIALVLILIVQIS